MDAGRPICRQQTGIAADVHAEVEPATAGRVSLSHWLMLNRPALPYLGFDLLI